MPLASCTSGRLLARTLLERYTLHGIQTHAGIDCFVTDRFLFAGLGQNRSGLLYVCRDVPVDVDGVPAIRLGWVSLFWLFLPDLYPKAKREPPRAYFSKPRTIVSFALMIAIVSAALHTLYSLYREYFI